MCIQLQDVDAVATKINNASAFTVRWKALIDQNIGKKCFGNANMEYRFHNFSGECE